MRKALCHLLFLSALCGGAASGPAQTMKTSESALKTNRTEQATFGGGCFWCLEAIFEGVDGVKSVASGYAGGQKANPTYEEVCSGGTGHAEVVQIEYDSQKLSYDKLLNLFWQAHDPTTVNRQGADVGTQYRSIILYQSEAQKQTAEKSKREAAGRLGASVVTEIVPLTRFYKAEDYHQEYFRKNPRARYCTFVIRPKLEKLKPKLANP